MKAQLSARRKSQSSIKFKVLYFFFPEPSLISSRQTSLVASKTCDWQTKDSSRDGSCSPSGPPPSIELFDGWDQGDEGATKAKICDIFYRTLLLCYNYGVLVNVSCCSFTNTVTALVRSFNLLIFDSSRRCEYPMTSAGPVCTRTKCRILITLRASDEYLNARRP